MTNSKFGISFPVTCTLNLMNSKILIHFIDLEDPIFSAGVETIFEIQTELDGVTASLKCPAEFMGIDDLTFFDSVFSVPLAKLTNVRSDAEVRFAMNHPFIPLDDHFMIQITYVTKNFLNLTFMIKPDGKKSLFIGVHDGATVENCEDFLSSYRLILEPLKKVLR